ncbi:response regulator transcription factor [Mammaliicoccus sciuri]|uniref:Response regulator transcription factor n=1 Tax=Mammaliicoccus sciuri TaxID=1296 RepID=A0AAJ4SFZ5_MAMSC|nr:response regulator transcription factor [Mammaliicoccus sciuri]MCJ0942904.1 response regulator transcription factor [Mammaliicoccus sciuri]MCJ1748550.1 response regulator transcription factor [Mammaliicoccus sciuri]MCJ1782004.1 response regulator transcription factor [Mammaliicoccus sciuri]MEB7065329.1 response regulator transcription factor [Mammaliicoccus sciuri]RTX70956.1 response regulator transcription factor [Mammaliicoccus sciuri]
MISIVIAEDQEMLRKAMVQLMEMNDELNILGDFSNGEDALESIQSLEPDVAILDVEMPKMTGLEVLKKVKDSNLNTKVIIVTTFKRPGYFESAVANDVDAYVLKERSIDELVETIKNVMDGKKEYSESLMTSMFKDRNPLSPKEQLVLKEIGKGLSSKEISKELYLSDGTIRNYTSIIIDKLEADNRFDAWQKAIEKGWI